MHDHYKKIFNINETVISDEFDDEIVKSIDDGSTIQHPKSEIYDYLENEEEMAELYEFGFQINLFKSIDKSHYTDYYNKDWEISEEDNRFELEDCYDILHDILTRSNIFKSEHNLPAFMLDPQIEKKVHFLNGGPGWGDQITYLKIPFSNNETFFDGEITYKCTYIHIEYNWFIYFNKIKDMSFKDYSFALYKLFHDMNNALKRNKLGVYISEVLCFYDGRNPKSEDKKLSFVSSSRFTPGRTIMEDILVKTYPMYVLGEHDYEDDMHEITNNPNYREPIYSVQKRNTIDRYNLVFADRVKTQGKAKAQKEYNLSLDVIGEYFDNRFNFSRNEKNKGFDTGFVTIEVKTTDGEKKYDYAKFERCMMECVFANIPFAILKMKFIYVVVKPVGLILTDYVTTNGNEKNYNIDDKKFSCESICYYKSYGKNRGASKYLWRVREVGVAPVNYKYSAERAFLVITNNKGELPISDPTDIFNNRNDGWPLYLILDGHIWMSQAEIERRNEMVMEIEKDAIELGAERIKKYKMIPSIDIVHFKDMYLRDDSEKED